MPGSPYRPITCAFYDELAIYAMHQKFIMLQFANDEGQIESCECLITDIYTLDKVEYCSLSSGEHIRLDRIRSINGQPVDAYET